MINNVIKNILTVCVLLSLMACGSVYQVKSYPVGVDNNGKAFPKVPKKTLVYRLPRNKVTVNITKTEEKITDGELKSVLSDSTCDIPELKGVALLSPKTTYVFSDPSFQLSAVPDNSTIYSINVKSPWNPFASRSATLKAGVNGLVTDFASTATDESFDAVVSALQTVVGLSGSKIMAQGIGVVPPGSSKDDKCNKAKDLVREWGDVENALSNLVRGETTATLSGVEIYDKMKTDLLAQRTAILANFIGVKEKSTTVYSFLFDPESQCTPVGGKCSYRLFDVVTGALDSSVTTTNGKPYLTGADIGATPASQGLYLQIDKDTDTNNFVKALKGNGAGKSNGFVYRVPGSAKISLTRVDVTAGNPINKVIANQEMAIADYGKTRGLPRRFGWTKSEITELKLDPLLGSLVSVRINGANLGSDEIDQLNQLVKDHKSDTELDDLKKELDYYETKKKLQDAKAALGIQ